MTSFPKYDRYKDSGVEWLGEIPEHWESEKGIRYFHETDQRSVSGDEELLSVSHLTGVTPRSEKNITMFLSESNVGLKVCEAGDIAVNTMWAWMAALGVSKYSGIVSPSYSTYRQKRPERFNPAYIDHLLRNEVYKSHYMVNSTGITTSRLRLYPHSFLRLKFICPPRDEQDRIVTFLDRKTAEIDALIAKKQRQIELLDEQKAILINRAVTKGIVNAEFGMRNEHLSTSSHSTFTTHHSKFVPSGIEWIGDIPEGWELVQLRRLIDGIEQGVSPATVEGDVSASDWGVLKSGCCNGGVFRESEHKRLPPTFKFDPKIAVRNGDLLVSRACGSRDLVGSTALVKDVTLNLILSDKNFRLLPRPVVEPEFLNLSMNSFHYRRQLDPRISGADGLPNNIPGARLKEIVIPLPPLNEQRDIVNTLAKVFEATNRGTARAADQIQSFKTLRSTLIAHAVTGRIKV